MKTLSIIIPAFNEKKTVSEVIRRVFDAPTPGYKKEIIAVDDGSTDGTAQILRNLNEKFHFTLLLHPGNLGKGAAIKTALEHVTGDAVLIQDADLEYDPNDYQELLKAFSSDNANVVYGSRNLGKAKRGYFFYFLGGKCITGFLNLMLGSNLTDVNTGYKLFPANALKKVDIESNGFGFCEEVTVKLLKAGYAIREVGIHYFPRTFSEGKKVSFRDGCIAIWTILKYK